MTIRNSDKPVLYINHRDLNHSEWNSIYKSDCPVCKEGVLAMSRDPETGFLSPEDHCWGCGQRFYYKDIKLDEITVEYKNDKSSSLLDWLRK